MAKIAILGFGTVGSGVLEVCRKNPRAMALYERLGYQPLDYLQMYLPLQEA